MKPFRFRLGRIQRIRKIEAEVASGELQSALARHAEAEKARDVLRDSITGLRKLWRERVSHGLSVSPAEILALESEIERQLVREGAAAKRLEVLSVDVDRARNIWAQRRSDQRALERLHEHRLEEHTLEAKREEAREADETSTRRSGNLFQDDSPTSR